MFAESDPGAGSSQPAVSGPATLSTIQQCYPTAPNLARPTTTPSTLTVPTTNGRPVASAYPSESFAARVTDDLVEIVGVQGKDVWKGSGVITTDAEGDEVILSAAHVDNGVAPKLLTVTTSGGQEVTPTGGCIIWANNDKLQTNVGNSAPLDTDILVLKIPKLVKDPLALASSDAKPGSVLTFINYQQSYGPLHTQVVDDTKAGSAAAYNGIVVPSGKGDPTLNVMTGLDTAYSAPTSDQFNMSHFEGGGSGGPLVKDVSGVPELVGITDSSDTTLGLDYLNDYGLSRNNVVFPGMSAGNNGFFPVDAKVQRLDVIRLVLAAPILASPSAG